MSGCVNQLGDTVSLDSLRGKVILIDFFFTHCASICPILTRNMRHMQDALKSSDKTKQASGTDTNFVQFLSLTVDPAHDSAPVLKRYADRYGVNSDLWWMLTGPKKTIYDFALKELKLGLQDSVSVDSNFVHTDYIALLDKDRVIRGYYHGTDTSALKRLSRRYGLYHAGEGQEPAGPPLSTSWAADDTDRRDPAGDGRGCSVFQSHEVLPGQTHRYERLSLTRTTAEL